MSKKSGKVDFVCIGAAKTGTTWLANCLRLHPELYVPHRKEINYFQDIHPYNNNLENINFGKPESWYHGFFDLSRDKQLWCDLSPQYMACKGVAERIAVYNKKVKILAVLRDPIDQVYSLYSFLEQRGKIRTGSFNVGIFSRPDLIEQGKYHNQLFEFYKHFKPSQIKILLYDDLQDNPLNFLRIVFNFIGIKEVYPDIVHKRANKTMKARIPHLNKFISGSRHLLHKYKMEKLIQFIRFTGLGGFGDYIKYKLNAKPDESERTLRKETKEALQHIYNNDIRKLEQLIGRDLSSWRSTT